MIGGMLTGSVFAVRYSRIEKDPKAFMEDPPALKDEISSQRENSSDSSSSEEEDWFFMILLQLTVAQIDSSHVRTVPVSPIAWKQLRHFASVELIEKHDSTTSFDWLRYRISYFYKRDRE